VVQEALLQEEWLQEVRLREESFSEVALSKVSEFLPYVALSEDAVSEESSQDV
jgi:hypothetical protein